MIFVFRDVNDFLRLIDQSTEIVCNCILSSLLEYFIYILHTPEVELLPILKNIYAFRTLDSFCLFSDTDNQCVLHICFFYLKRDNIQAVNKLK